MEGSESISRAAIMDAITKETLYELLTVLQYEWTLPTPRRDKSSLCITDRCEQRRDPLGKYVNIDVTHPGKQKRNIVYPKKVGKTRTPKIRREWSREYFVPLRKYMRVYSALSRAQSTRPPINASLSDPRRKAAFAVCGRVIRECRRIEFRWHCSTVRPTHCQDCRWFVINGPIGILIGAGEGWRWRTRALFREFNERYVGGARPTELIRADARGSCCATREMVQGSFPESVARRRKLSIRFGTYRSRDGTRSTNDKRHSNGIFSRLVQIMKPSGENCDNVI